MNRRLLLSTGLACLAMQLFPAPVSAEPIWWAEYQQLPIDVADAAQGSAVAMTSNLLVVGQPGRSDRLGTTTLLEAGAVQVFRWNNGWQLKNTFHLAQLGQTPVAHGHFGAAVAVSGDRVVVGCPGCGLDQHVFLFDVSDPAGTVGVFPLHVFDANEQVSDPLLGTGAAVAMDGDLIAVGSPRTRFGTSTQEIGAVQLGRFDGSAFNWFYEVAGQQDGGHAGQSVAVTEVNYGGTIPTSAIYLAWAAPAYVNSGSFGLAGRAFLAKKSSLQDHWTTMVFDNPNPGLADGMGLSLAYYHPQGHADAYLAMGLPGRSINGHTSGSVRIYHAGPYSDSYDFEKEISLPNPVSGDHFGSSLAMAGNTFLLVGAPGRAVDLSANAGSAYLYLKGTYWNPIQTLFRRSAGNQAFGTSVAMFTPGGGAVGAPAYGTNGQGNVYTYMCDQIFVDEFESDGGAVCSTP